MKDITLITYTDGSEVFVTTPELEETLIQKMKEWKFDLEDFARQEGCGCCVQVELNASVVVSV